MNNNGSENKLSNNLEAKQQNLTRETDKAKATEFLNKALALNPTDKNALLLQKELSK